MKLITSLSVGPRKTVAKAPVGSAIFRLSCISLYGRVKGGFVIESLGSPIGGSFWSVSESMNDSNTNGKPSRWGPKVSKNSLVDDDDVEIIDYVEWDDGSDRFGSGELAPRPRREVPDKCGCAAGTKECCADETCVLFACQEECYRCHDNCKNQRISKKEWKETVVFDAGPKGRGLKAVEEIRKGDFIAEYVGRAIRKAYLERLFSRYKNERMLYIMALDSITYIDARKRGGIARYINHSCDPNCEVQRWKVNGILRAGIFASKNIAAGEELSFDYKWERKRGRAATKCHCRSRNCRGTIELPKSMEEEELERKLLGHWKKPPNPSAGREIINRSIRIMAPEHHEYFSADVCKYDEKTRKHLVMYRHDLEEVWEDLSQEDWMLLDEEAEQFIIAKKKSGPSSSDVGSSSSLLGAGLRVEDAESLRGVRNYFFIQTPVKELLMAKGIIERCRYKWQVTMSVTKCSWSNQPTIGSSQERQEFESELGLSRDGSVWKIMVSGSQMQNACLFLSNNVLKVKSETTALSPSLTNSSPAEAKHAGVTEEVIFPRCAVEYMKKRLHAVRERAKSVNITYAPSESKSKQFARLVLDASLASDLENAKAHLWIHLLECCKEANAPTAPCGVYMDLGFFGGDLRSDLFRLLVNKPPETLNIECNEDLRLSSFFTSFQGTQRCTVWVQSEEDMGRIDGQNRIVSEYNPMQPRKMFFGCDPTNVKRLWQLVESRARELERGVRYFHLGSDRMYQQLMMRNSGQFFDYVERIAGASVTIDSMTGDHLRIDGSASGAEVIEIGDWDSEVSLTPGGRAALAEELIQLQIELYRDHCIRQQSLIFGRDWTLSRYTSESDQRDLKTPSTQLSNTRGATPDRRFDKKSVSSVCIDMAEITANLRFDGSVAAHGVIILYRFLKLAGEKGVQPCAKLREIVLASLYLANKAQKVSKWKKLESLLEAAYPTFYPGSRFDREKEEARILEQRVLAAEEEVLDVLDYDIFWKGTGGLMHAAISSGQVSEPLAKNALDHALSGTVLAAGSSLWLKYGIDYVFAAVAGFLSVNIEPLFDALSLIPLKVSQAAELIAESIRANATRKTFRSMFSGGKEALLNNLEDIKLVCMKCMAKGLAENGQGTIGLSEVAQRYQVIGHHDKHRLVFKGAETKLLADAIVPVIDGLSAESNCKIYIENASGSENVVLEGSWRALAIAEHLLKVVAGGTGSDLPAPIESFVDDTQNTFKVQAKADAGLLRMDTIQTAEGWDGTLQSAAIGNAPSWGRKVGGKACVAGKVTESTLRNVGLRWWIPPSYAPSPSGSICDMFCLRAVSNKEDERTKHLKELSGLERAMIGQKTAKATKELAKFSLLANPPTVTKDRSVALSMQRWPSEKVLKREKGKAPGNSCSLGFSPAALQEMQLLTSLHSAIPSPRGHPNFILPVAIALPDATPESAPKASQPGEQLRSKLKEEDIFSLFRTSEENERRAQKEKRRIDMVSGPHLVFHPTPFVLQRVMSESKKSKKSDASETLSPHLLAAWFHDLLSALVHCHSNHVVIRALQPDQIVIDDSGVAKLAGLYRATVLPPNERETSINPLRNARSKRDKKQDDMDDCSSTPYVAPENLLGCMKHTKETDVWSVGSLMSHLLLKKPLFQGKERKSMLSSMLKIVGTSSKENYPDASRFPHYPKLAKKYKRGVSKAIKHLLKGSDVAPYEGAIDLIEAMLHLDPKKRITAREALKHEYMIQYLENCNTNSFRGQFVDDWMKVKRKLVSSSRSEMDQATAKDKTLKRKAMLEAAKHLSTVEADEEVDDLYNIDDVLMSGNGSSKKQKVEHGSS